MCAYTPGPCFSADTAGFSGAVGFAVGAGFSADGARDPRNMLRRLVSSILLAYAPAALAQGYGEEFVVGDIRVARRTLLHKSARVEGEIQTAGIVVEEGARFKGCILIGRDEPRPAPGVAGQDVPSLAAVRDEPMNARQAEIPNPHTRRG